MKKYILIAIVLGLSACNDSNVTSIPIYESGMSQEQYIDSVTSYFNKQFNRHTEREIEDYAEFVASLPSRLPQNINELPQNEMVEIIDNLVKESMDLSSKNMGLTLNDWRFIIDPYVGKDASKASLRWVQEFFIGIYSKLAVPSTYLFAEKLNRDSLYYLIKHTNYPVLLQDSRFVEVYENRQALFNEVKQLLNNDSLAYIDIREYEDIQHKLAKLKNEISWNQPYSSNYQGDLKRFERYLTNAKNELSKDPNSKYWQGAVKEYQDELKTIQTKLDMVVEKTNKLLAEYKQLNDEVQQSKSMNENNIQHWKSAFETIETIYAKYKEKDRYSLEENFCAGGSEFIRMYRCYSELFSKQGMNMEYKKVSQ